MLRPPPSKDQRPAEGVLITPCRSLLREVRGRALLSLGPEPLRREPFLQDTGHLLGLKAERRPGSGSARSPSGLLFTSVDDLFEGLGDVLGGASLETTGATRTALGSWRRRCGVRSALRPFPTRSPAGTSSWSEALRMTSRMESAKDLAIALR